MAGAAGMGSSGDSTFFPEPGATGVCPDPSLRIRFDGTPTLGNSGSLRVYDAANAGSPVVTIDMATSQISDTVGGSSFTLPRPAYVRGNEAIFVLPSAGLGYGKTFYVTMDATVVSGPGVASGISDPTQWRFSTADAAPSNASQLRVALDGSGQFCSVQGAIDASTNGSTISVGVGAYYGIVYFTDKNDITLSGDDRNGTLIAGVNNNILNPSTRGRALFGAEDTPGLTIENVTIHNETPQGGSQAEALALLSCDRCIVRNATIRSLQDTLLWSGRLYADNCLIEGNVDYIWGGGAVYFNQCEIKTVGRKGYNLQARNPANGYGYVFVDSKLTADAGITGDILARIDVAEYPASHVAYIDCELGPHIAPEGWTITGGGSTSSLRFWEYQSRDPEGNLIDTSRRASGSRQITADEAASMRDPSVVLGGWGPQ